MVSLDGIAESKNVASSQGGSGGSAGSSASPGGAGNGGTMGPADAGGAGMGADADAAVPDDAKPDVQPDARERRPEVVYTVPAGAIIRGITVYGPLLYWVEAGLGRGIFRMPKEGGSMPLQIRQTASATDVAVDGTFIYWGAGNEISRMPIMGGTETMPDTLGIGAATARYITVDDQGVSYGTSVSYIVSVKPEGGTGLPASMQTGISGIAFYAGPDAGVRDLIWGHSTGISEGTLMGGPPAVPLYTGGSTDPVQGVATDGEFMYWISNGRSIKKGSPRAAIPITDLCFDPPQDLFPDGGSDAGFESLADIAVDDKWVYFTWPARNQILRCPKN